VLQVSFANTGADQLDVARGEDCQQSAGVGVTEPLLVERYRRAKRRALFLVEFVHVEHVARGPLTRYWNVAVLKEVAELERIPFRTGAPVPGERGVLTLRRRRVGEEKWEWDLDLGLLVRAAWFRQVLFGLVVAFFLAVPPIVGAYQNSNLSNDAQHVITVAAILSSLLAGITAAFGLRRSL
jgi:hypothetical protein